VHLAPTITEPAGLGTAFDAALGEVDEALRTDGNAAAAGDHALPAGNASGMASAQGGLVLTALAALAAGRAQRVRPLLERLDGALLPLLLGRFTAWTGQLTTAAKSWERARAAAWSASPDSSDVTDVVLQAGALAAAERLAADLGDAAAAARLHARLRDVRPMLDDLPGASPAASLARWLDLHPRAAHTLPYDPGRSGGVLGPGQATRGSAPATVLALVHEVLGIQPDALRHRIWLRPRLPPACRALEVREVRVGDDIVEFRLELEETGDGGCMRLRTVQDAGAIPATALVELLVPGAPGAVRVDRSPAALGARQADGGTLVAVQLVLDHERLVEVEFTRTEA
jgi:hypothetical protein